MKASILDLRRHMPDILKALDQNEQVTLTYRGNDKATIVPKERVAEFDLKKHPAFGMWSGKKETSDVAAFVRQLRKGRTDAF